MLATHHSSPAAPSRMLGTPASDLKFRVQGGEHHGRTLRISAAKCSIGSAVGCTLRLRGDGIEPLHCLILSGRNGTLIRRNSPRTYLNGGPFEDAALHPGDILRVGPVEMVVVACPQPVCPAATPSVSPEVDANYFEQAAKVEERIAEEVSRTREQEQVEQQRLARELCQTTEQLRLAQEELASALQLRERATIESQQMIEQLREQYAQGLEQSLIQLRQERAEGKSREEQIQEELRLERENAEQLTVRLAQQEAMAEQEATNHLQQIALSRDDVTEQVRQLEAQLNEARQQAEQRATERLLEQQRVQEDFTAVRGRLEGSISQLTEQLQQREAELAASHRREGECAETLTFALDDARQELRALQVQQSKEEEQRTSYRKQWEDQITDLTARLMEREKALAQRDQDLAELHQRSVHLDATGHIVQHLEENLAAATAAHQVEKEAWQAEKMALESRASDSEAARLQGESHRNGLEAQCNCLVSQCSELETKLNDLQVQHGDLQSRFENQETQLGTLQAECSGLQTQCSSLEAQRRDLELQLTVAQEAASSQGALEEQLANLRSSLEQVANQNVVQQAAQEEAIRSYEEQVERWQSEAHRWQLQAEETACQLIPLQQRFAQLELELESVRLESTTHAVSLAEEERRNLEDMRSQQETRREQLAESQVRIQEEQAQLQQSLTEVAERQEVLIRKEAELCEREAAWEMARAEQSSMLEERSQRIASQIAHFEAEQAAFARQQATIIQQMSTLEDRVHHLTTASESRLTNSPFVIPRLDDPALLENLERAEQPYVRANSVGTSEAVRLDNFQIPGTPPDGISAEVAPPEPTAEPLGDEVRLVSSRLDTDGSGKEIAEGPEAISVKEVHQPASETPRYTPPSFLDQAAEMVRQEELAGSAGHPGNTGSLSSSHAARQPVGTSFTTGNEEEDDDSIEEYMNRLLSRVRGGEALTKAATASQPLPSTSASTSVPVEIGDAPLEPKEYVPRVHAPEPSERLSLMRALANTAAESAIQAYARQSQKREIKWRSLVALLSLLGPASLFVASFYTGSRAALVGSLAFVAVCCVMAVRAISSSYRWKALAVPAEKEEQPAAENAPPQCEQV